MSLLYLPQHLGHTTRQLHLEITNGCEAWGPRKWDIRETRNWNLLSANHYIALTGSSVSMFVIYWDWRKRRQYRSHEHRGYEHWNYLQYKALIVFKNLWNDDNKYKITLWSIKVRDLIFNLNFGSTEFITRLEDESRWKHSIKIREWPSLTEVKAISENIKRMERSRLSSHVFSFRFVGTCHKRSKSNMKMITTSQSFAIYVSAVWGVELTTPVALAFIHAFNWNPHTIAI